MTEIEVDGRTYEIPIHTHTRVLGVDVAVPQLRHFCDMHGERYPYGGGPEVEINALRVDGTLDPLVRAQLAAWSRRTLFRLEHEAPGGQP